MSAKKHTRHEKPKHYFSHYLDDPLVGAAFVSIGLITLLLALMEFTRAIS